MRFLFRLILTERCQGSCPFCFNRDLRHGHDMDVDKLFRFLDYNAMATYNGLPQNSFYYCRRAMIMGGEPTLHPRFQEVVERLQKELTSVVIYSNGIDRQWLEWWKPRADDRVVFNGYAYPFSESALDDIKRIESNVSFHLVVAQGERETVIEKARQVHHALPKSKIVLSPDMMVDLDRHPDYVAYWESVIPEIEKIDNDYVVDHMLPKCVMSPEMTKRLLSRGERIGNCGVSRCGSVYSKAGCMGLINAQFDVRYCNNTPLKLGNLFINGKIMTFQEVYKMLLDARAVKEELVAQRPGCAKCPSLKTCLGGCYRIKHVKIPEEL